MPCMYAKIWLSYREQNIHFLCRWNGLHALWSWQDPPQTPSDSLRSLLVVKSPRGSAPLLPTQCGWASTFDLLFWGSLLPFFLFLLSSPLLLPLPLLVSLLWPTVRTAPLSSGDGVIQYWWSAVWGEGIGFASHWHSRASTKHRWRSYLAGAINH